MINGHITKGGFFDGIGGFDIAADWMGWQTVFHCELDEFCKRILKHHWPHAKNYGDITKADFSFWRGKIDVLTGGFPCQPFSTAGKRGGTNDNRYLWPQMCKAIEQIRPTFVVGENVTGILTMEDKSHVSKDVFFRVDGRNRTQLKEADHYEALYTRQSKMLLNNIIKDLEEIGYTVQTFIVPASATQAPHRRERTWIIAYDNGAGLQTKRTQQQTERSSENGSGRDATHPNSQGHQHHQPGEDRCTESPYKEEENQWQRLWTNLRGASVKTDVTNAQSRRNGGLRNPKQKTGPQESNESPREQYRVSVEERNIADTTRIGGNQDNRKGEPKQFNQDGKGEYWREFPTQSPVCSRNDGLSAQLDGITFSKWRNQSIKGYGNAVVPQVVLEFYKAIEIELRKLNPSTHQLLN